MTCSGCVHRKTTNKEIVLDNRKPNHEGIVVEKSNSPNAKIRIRYYGGGSKKSVGSGCHTCHGKGGGYVVTTSETIRFVSEDCPDGWFKMTFNIGHDYYVTEAQAEYLLTLEYRNRAGQIVKKFKKVEE